MNTAIVCHYTGSTNTKKFSTANASYHTTYANIHHTHKIKTIIRKGHYNGLSKIFKNDAMLLSNTPSFYYKNITQIAPLSEIVRNIK